MKIETIYTDKETQANLIFGLLMVRINTCWSCCGSPQPAELVEFFGAGGDNPIKFAFGQNIVDLMETLDSRRTVLRNALVAERSRVLRGLHISSISYRSYVDLDSSWGDFVFEAENLFYQYAKTSLDTYILNYWDFMLKAYS